MRLRETVPADLDILLSWVPSEADMVLWSGRTFTWPLDRGQLENYLQNAQRRYWTGLDPESGNPVGHASLLVDDDAAMMRLGCVLLDPAARGRGWGRELISTAVRTGFETTELPTMKLGVYAHNISARRVYEDLGFQKTGRVRSTEVNGQPWHAMEMERPRLA
ncbi:GNAT family N-acetyltransferase [Kocuria salina]|uniref:GNAT family N-acetyltransferase n=1 Tax=Kocuria salina TaxID=1929416 RepID=UPI001593CB16|nr:N-acetyltransferase [Kocuria salina]NVC25039.1 GNAT family N-acetyltransferase [Kocuria salina]